MVPTGFKKIWSRYPATCYLCKVNLEVGDSVYWNPKKGKTQKILCVSCAESDTAPAPTPTPDETETTPKPLSNPTPDMPKVLLQVWSSFSEFVDYVEKTPSSKHWSKTGRARRSGKDSYNDWTGWTEALELAKNGWSYGTQIVGNSTAQIMGTRYSTKRTDGFDLGVSGMFPEVGAVLTGSPLCHVTIAEGRQMVGKVVRITADLVCNAYVTGQQMKLYGAALCILVQTIERSGASVEVVGAFDVQSLRHTEYYLCHRIRLKDAGQPLDMDRLAFMLGHPASLRRLVLHAIETTDWAYFAGFETGHGRATYVPNVSDGIVISSCYRDDLDSAVEAVESRYNDQLRDEAI